MDFFFITQIIIFVCFSGQLNHYMMEKTMSIILL